MLSPEYKAIVEECMNDEFAWCDLVEELHHHAATDHYGFERGAGRQLMALRARFRRLVRDARGVPPADRDAFAAAYRAFVGDYEAIVKPPVLGL